MREMAVKILAYQTVTLPCVPGPLHYSKLSEGRNNAQQ